MPRYIDADALLCDIIERYCKDCDKRKGVKNGKRRIIYEIGDAPCKACDICDMAGEIEEAPTADVVERKKGKWVDGRCSECGEHAPFWSMASTYHTTPYCYNCGAMMSREE